MVRISACEFSIILVLMSLLTYIFQVIKDKRGRSGFDSQKGSSFYTFELLFELLQQYFNQSLILECLLEESVIVVYCLRASAPEARKGRASVS